MKTILKTLVLLFSIASFAQTTVKGTVNDESGMPLAGANVIVVGTSNGVVTDFDGNFTLSVSENPPFTIQVSSVGFTSATQEITSNNQTITVSLAEGSFLDEVVISASRVPQRIFESPVTVEKYSLKQIERTPSSDYFEGLQNVKGVQMNQTGLVFSQVNTRGFGTVYNEGFVTLVDGMNTQAPVFGFAVGNLIGLNELDVQSVELLPGAASALYGMDAYKGIMSITSKNPFDHEGVNVYVRSGSTQQQAGGNNSFTDFGIRLAKKLSDKWAVKVAISAKEGTEWAAADTRHKRECANCGDGSIVEGYDPNAPDFDAVNEYGQRLITSQDIWGALEQYANGDPALAPFVPQIQAGQAAAPDYWDNIMSTGYTEQELFGNEANNLKGNAGIYFRPNNNTEISLSSLYGTGEAPLPAGNARYNIKDFVVQMHKLQLKSGGLNAQLYYTHEDAGKTTQSTALGISVANAMNGGIEGGWGLGYMGAYLTGLSGGPGVGSLGAGLGAALADIGGGSTSVGSGLFANVNALSHIGARAYANTLMLNPDGSNINALGVNFNQALENATNTAILSFTDIDSPLTGEAANGDLDWYEPLGALIKDVSTAYTFEANYDFEDKIKFANVLVGGLYRAFNLDTDGTLYTDYDAPIEYNEFGVYGQLQKDLFDDTVSLTASLRYDKVEVMEDANVTPRLGLLFKLSDNQNLRVSAQVGYRNPTNQDKFIGLYNGQEVLLGSTKQNIDRFNTTLGGFNWTGNQVFETALNKSAWDNGGNVVSEALNYVEAEKVTSFDIGYRFNSKDFTVDVNAYWSDYENYIGTNSVYVPVDVVVGQLEGLGLTNAAATQTAMGNGAFAQFGVDANLDVPFSTYGLSIEAIKKLSDKVAINLIYEYNNLDYSPEANSNFELSWNTPKNRVKLGLTSKIGENFSFATNARYNSEYYYESSFIDATIKSNTVIDAKLTYTVPSFDGLKIEVGGNNIGGDEYVSIPGSGNIGSLYYAGLKVGF